MQFKAVGIVESRFEQQAGTPIQGKMAPKETACIRIFDEFAAGLKDIEGFSHIYVFFKFDRASEAKLLVKPYLDTVERGVFATRSPLRPNPLGMTIVKLERVENNCLYVSGVDILNGSPVIDIKPYIPDFDQHNPEKIGWYENKNEKSDLVLADDRFANPRSDEK
ncbi:MAG: tRNA (N6-threonylcarbamoyladenosine(37)-N6)-methyltransferase TrmO [Candidatus Riflebacteria bacterium]|nr:tRNA (N6-threonylcarbamoyladenosine(37)-N6)-methyltransferase TrmO [Candidatus Riflebacteria bacterium]